MERANRFHCPRCGAPLRSARGVRVGRTIKCPSCKGAFTVRPEDAAGAEQAQGVNADRLAVVLAAAMFYLLIGSGLAVYCFTHNAPQEVAQAGDGDDNWSGDGDGADDGEWSDLPPRGPAGVSAAEQRRIDDAIVRGVWFLKENTFKAPNVPGKTWGNALPEQRVTDVTVGFASLPALTLLECGIPAADPLVVQAAAHVRQQVVKLGNVYDGYQRALAILFLDRLGDPEDEELIQYLALCLVAAQHSTEGAWSYGSPKLDRTMTAQLVKLLADPKTPLDEWRKTALKGGTYNVPTWDNSNTQFAILALWVARRHGIAVDRTMALAEQHFRKTQMAKQDDPAKDNLDLDGSWYYDRNGAPGWRNSSRWPSMTCAGLLALGFAHGATVDAKGQQPREPVDDDAIRRGLAMLAREIGRDGEKRPTDLYFLWSLERVGVLYGLDRIGDKDWYAWGRKELLDQQDQTDGSWKAGAYYDNVPVLNTCFALLFLKQANLTKDLKLQLLDKAK
jgi:hypothetical protein